MSSIDDNTIDTAVVDGETSSSVAPPSPTSTSTSFAGVSVNRTNAIDVVTVTGKAGGSAFAAKALGVMKKLSSMMIDIVAQLDASSSSSSSDALDGPMLRVLRGSRSLIRAHHLDIDSVVIGAEAAGSTLLHMAISARQGTIVKELIELGANTNSTDVNGDTPLHIAIRNIDEDEKTLSISKSSSSFSSSSLTPIGEGVAYTIISLLLDSGGDLLLVNHAGLTSTSLLTGESQRIRLAKEWIASYKPRDMQSVNDKGNISEQILSMKTKGEGAAGERQHGYEAELSNDIGSMHSSVSTVSLVAQDRSDAMSLIGMMGANVKQMRNPDGSLRSPDRLSLSLRRPSTAALSPLSPLSAASAAAAALRLSERENANAAASAASLAAAAVSRAHERENLSAAAALKKAAAIARAEDESKEMDEKSSGASGEEGKPSRAATLLAGAGFTFLAAPKQVVASSSAPSSTLLPTRTLPALLRARPSSSSVSRPAKSSGLIRSPPPFDRTFAKAAYDYSRRASVYSGPSGGGLGLVRLAVGIVRAVVGFKRLVGRRSKSVEQVYSRLDVARTNDISNVQIMRLHFDFHSGCRLCDDAMINRVRSSLPASDGGAITRDTLIDVMSTIQLLCRRRTSLLYDLQFLDVNHTFALNFATDTANGGHHQLANGNVLWSINAEAAMGAMVDAKVGGAVAESGAEGALTDRPVLPIFDEDETIAIVNATAKPKKRTKMTVLKWDTVEQKMDERMPIIKSARSERRREGETKIAT